MVTCQEEVIEKTNKKKIRLKMKSGRSTGQKKLKIKSWVTKMKNGEGFKLLKSQNVPLNILEETCSQTGRETKINCCRTGRQEAKAAKGQRYPIYLSHVPLFYIRVVRISGHFDSTELRAFWCCKIFLFSLNQQ